MTLPVYQQMILKNRDQGDQKRVLCVCSVGLLRSPTLAHLLNTYYDINARACGIDDFALIQFSEKLAYWADVIFVIGSDNLLEVNEALREYGFKRNVFLLDIEDDYEYLQPELVVELEQKIGELYETTKL